MVNAIIWILAIVVFLALEAATAMLVSIWFAGGALAALFAMLFGANAKVQILVFLMVSVVFVILLRSAAVKSLHGKQKKTNLDRIIGQEIVISEAVDNKSGLGKAFINDVEWKVKSEDGEDIAVGEVVKVIDIEGVKLIVKR